jgi:hypothetical protein
LRKVTRVRGTVILRPRNLLGISILLSVQFPTILSKNQEDWGCRSKVRVETNFDRSFTQKHTFTGTLGRPKDVYLAYFLGFFVSASFDFRFLGTFRSGIHFVFLRLNFSSYITILRRFQFLLLSA